MQVAPHIRWRLLLVGIITLVGCTAKYSTDDLRGYSQKSIRLANGLGLVSVYLPQELDTFYTTVNYGEYHCAEIKLHRFASRKYDCCLSNGSDFSYFDLSDSLYQFTITQTFRPDCEQFVTIDAGELNEAKDYYMSLDKKAAALRKYYMKEINGKNFIISELSLKTNGMELRELDGITDANGRMIRFIYKCFSKSPGNFLDRMKESLKTIQITQESKAGQT